MSDNLDLDAQPQQPNIDPQLGLYAIYVKKLEEQFLEMTRRCLNVETNNEVLQNSLNQANEAYAKLNEQFQQLGVGMHATTQERDALQKAREASEARLAELEALRAEKDRLARQNQDLQYELQNQINRANEATNRIAIVEQNMRGAIDRASAAELEASKLAGELKRLKEAKPDPLNLDEEPVKKQPKKKVAKVK